MPTIAQRFIRGDFAVRVRRGGRVRRITDPELSAAIGRSYALWLRLKALETELSEARGLIARRAGELCDGGATVSFEAGGVTCAVTLRHEAEVPEENVSRLKKLLGRRFKELVRTKVRHMATSRLVGEAGGEALALIRMRELSPQFRWSARVGPRPAA